ncbi:hypothetical protein LZ198_05090 [Myxococcus sp. K15C18031901]|uniref:hypothetical protein n=1 Tax=Myxococcus dinghuensis TaxID=2906761 RepID=UPI0020A8256B|nr:hypothetical protein [Myxococcus dinghuensis]MCP3098252.1 hypothetical protein [Myxococcus dinghuensis]
MQKHLQWLLRSGVLLGVVALAACNAGSMEEDAALERSGAELTCGVSQQCANGSTVSCGSASGVCTSGTDNGGWVECDGARTYCAPACTCSAARQFATATGAGDRCPIAYADARDALEAHVAAQCPAGACGIIEVENGCRAIGSGPWVSFEASLTYSYSCLEPANCQ